MTAILMLPVLDSRYFNTADIPPDESVSKAPVAIVKPPTKKDEPKKETLPKTNKTVNFIVELNAEPLIDIVTNSDDKYNNVSELVLSGDCRSILDTIKKNQAVVKASIQKLIARSDFSESHTFCAVFNGFSVKAPANEMDKIEKINGVKRVYIDDIVLNGQDISDISASPANISEEQLKLLNYSPELDGQNTLIAVIDSEFDVLHSAFAEEPPALKYDSDTVRSIFDTVNFSVGSNCKFEDVSKSDKIIYAYDYADSDTDTRENRSHGTATAALAGGNDSENGFKGIAYNAQLAFMKVCGSDGLAHADSILSALDDCAKLGTDIINISLGNEKLSDIFESPLEKLSKTGTVIICPCGNSGLPEKQDTYNIDYGTLNCLAEYDSVISVSSSTNPYISAEYLIADGNRFLYNNVGDELKFTDIPDENREYIFLEKNDKGEYDFSQAENKIAVIETDLAESQDHAQQAFFAGAKALAVIDSGNFENDRNFSIERKNIPVIIVDDDYTNYFAEYTQGTLDIPETAVLADSIKKNTMSKFSSWGVTADLKLKPEITAVGENVLSANSNGSYSYVSGTSFSSALVSGTYAVVSQYLKQYEWFNSLSPAEQNNTVTSFIMSNAEPVKQYDYDNDELLYISPRKQGAGRTDIESIMQSGAYLTTENGIPKASMGDSADGEFSFNFTVRNVSEGSQVFSISSFIETDRFEADDDSIINMLEPYSLKDISTVRFLHDGEEVTEIEVSGGQQADISVEIEVNGDELKEFFPNGFYIDGYTVLENEHGRTLNFPFTAFYGEWENIDPFYEEMVKEHNSLVSVDYNADSEPVSIDGYMSKTMTGNFYDISQMKNSYLLPNFRLMRDVHDFTVTVSDSNAKVLFSKNYGTVRKNAGELYRDLLSDSGDIAEFFSNLPDGDYIYAVSARTVTADGSVSDDIYDIKYLFAMDSEKPVILSSKTYKIDDKTYLELTAKDNKYIKGFELYTAAYNVNTRKYEYADRLDDLKNTGYLSEGAYELEEVTENEDGSVTHRYDITSLYSELVKLEFMTRTSISPFSPLHIAYRAYDGTYRKTEIKIADTVTYQKAVFTFTDQNGKPAPDIKISLDKKTAVSDKNGNAVFEGLLPDVYLAQIVSLPDGYSCSEEYFVIPVGSDDFMQEIPVGFSGEYPEISEIPSKPPEVSRTESYISEVPEINGDDPVYAIALTGILVIISSVAFALNRRRRK